MRRLLLSLVFLFCCSAGSAALDGRSISELEARKAEIDRELEALARPSLRGGVGAIGFHTAPFKNAEHPFWVEIDLGEVQMISEIALLPVLWRNMEEGFKADAFPTTFRVRVGTAEDREGRVIAEYAHTEDMSRSVTPLMLSFAETPASWVRLEVPHLFKRVLDDKYVFQLSEILIFSEGKNVALRRPLKTSLGRPRDPSGAWDEGFLVDGTTPYIMNSARGRQSLGFLSDFGATPALYIDLGVSRPISGIHLHAVEQSNTVPQAFVGDLGIPKHFKVEGAETPDFTDVTVLLDYQSEKISDTGLIMMWNIPEASCRYVRLVTIEPSISFGVSERLSRVGFAEIELISNGENVALGKEAWADPVMRNLRSPLALTDGQNLYGEILPVRMWMKELALRHDLELERRGVMDALDVQYELQKKVLIGMGWMLVVALFVIVFVVLYSRILRIRNETQVRERIAANLHDELGANLHAIGMWSDIAQESVDTPGPLIETLQKIRTLTERAGASARFCTNMLEATGVCEILVDEMKREARRLLADVQYVISFENEVALNRLKRRQRIDIYLFFKESLTNIIRHGQATIAKIELSTNMKELRLTIADDGCGFTGGLPKSLRRRAKLMRAIATVDHPKEGGTLISLKLKVNKRSFK
ncbi:MAG: sensor histidine kinase [Opitutaceae bacterium]